LQIGRNTALGFQSKICNLNLQSSKAAIGIAFGRATNQSRKIFTLPNRNADGKGGWLTSKGCSLRQVKFVGKLTSASVGPMAMNRFRIITVSIVFLGFSSTARAGLYYSGEVYAELPAQWRGFLLDQRVLRNIAVKPAGNQPANPARTRYEQAAAKLEKTGRERKLTADESADLGVIYIRLGEIAKAVEILRAAQRQHANHFRLAANLGTAWQLQGDLEQAAVYLQQAVRLAPGKLQKAEEYHLQLVRLRLKSKTPAGLDDLFGVRFFGEDSQYQPGKLAATERKKLPAEAVAIVQQLALWLPADGPLLWQLAELANAHGDLKMAAAIMDGCVTEFGMNAAELRRHRQLTRAAADEQAAPMGKGIDAKAAHESHAASLRTRSSRPLLTKLDEAALPAVRGDAVNALPWTVLAETALDRKFHPTFAKYLQELDGKQITLDGYMQPLGEELEMGVFLLIENPVGCWYCEMPDITGIVLVQMPEGKAKTYTRAQVKVVGQLKLNSNDPENFLYTITQAKVTGSE
jgi:tetratricopeptide (TPR) repeat protein